MSTWMYPNAWGGEWRCLSTSSLRGADRSHRCYQISVEKPVSNRSPCSKKSLQGDLSEWIVFVCTEPHNFQFPSTAHELQKCRNRKYINYTFQVHTSLKNGAVFCYSVQLQFDLWCCVSSQCDMYILWFSWSNPTLRLWSSFQLLDKLTVSWV